MNANCCSTTSNLNNPSLQIQETIKIRSAMRTTQPNEVFYFEELANDSKRLRLAADTRRLHLNLSIIASYTFSNGETNLLDNTIINYNNNNQQQQQYSTANNINQRSPPQSIQIPTVPTNPSTPNYHYQQYNNSNNDINNNNVDSTIDSSSLPASQTSLNPSPKKKKRDEHNSFLRTTNNFSSTPKHHYSLRRIKLVLSLVIFSLKLTCQTIPSPTLWSVVH